MLCTDLHCRPPLQEVLERSKGSRQQRASLAGWLTKRLQALGSSKQQRKR
jgi:hypothetical protein